MGRVKKASKKGWKRVHHEDLDLFLEQERQKERQNLEAEANETFFTVDTTPQQRAAESRESEQLVDLSKLKCFQILKPSSTVPDPLVKRNKVRINPKRVKVAKTEPKSELSEKSLVDPWADQPEKKGSLDGEWLYEDTLRQNTKISKKRMNHSTTELKPIEIPHPGFSVNPTYGDHQALLRAAVDAEFEQIRKEEKLKKATSIPANASKEDEMMKLETFFPTQEEVEIKSEPEDDEDKKPILTKPKTKKQRRKERVAKEALQSAAEEKQTRVRESDVFKIKQYKRQIEKKDKLMKARHQKRTEKKVAHEKFGQKTLSKWKFEDEKVNPLLSEEVSGRLIGVKGTASILLDRFKSFQKRNILEVRVKQRQQRVRRLKRYQRPSEKMDWEINGVWNGIKL